MGIEPTEAYGGKETSTRATVWLLAHSRPPIIYTSLGVLAQLQSALQEGLRNELNYRNLGSIYVAGWIYLVAQVDLGVWGRELPPTPKYGYECVVGRPLYI